MKKSIIFTLLSMLSTPALASLDITQCQVKESQRCQFLTTGLQYCVEGVKVTSPATGKFEITIFKTNLTTRYEPEVVQAEGKLSLEGLKAQWDEGDGNLIIDICQEGKCPGTLILEQDFAFKVECE